MSPTRSRIGLVTVFLAGFVIQAAAIISTSLREQITSRETQDLLLKLLAAYSVHLGVILGGIFGQAKTRTTRVSPAPFWLAFGLALLWNGLFVWRALAFALLPVDSVKAFATYMESMAASSSFLVAGALAYFFASK
jgi:hypothetical protein